MSDELTFNASDNDVAPESPMLLSMECDSIKIDLSHSIIKPMQVQLSEGWIDLQCFWQWCCSWISNVVPNGMWFNNNQLIIFNNKLTLRFNWASDELTFNASDNDVAPDEPILLQMECDWITIN